MNFKLLLMFFMCVILLYLFNKIKSLQSAQPYFLQCECIYEIPSLLEQAITENKIKNLYIPCTYNDVGAEILKMPKVKNGKYFIIENCDMLTAKELLWQIVVGHYGLQTAQTILPNSYVLSLNADMNRFKKDFNKSIIYILKKNKQRQEGLKITKSFSKIKNAYKDDYVIVQELLQDPYTINKHKINIRFYVFVICRNNKICIYVYNDGFIYYTKKHFKKNKLDIDTNVTTGYIDRQIYVNNPLTHSDLKYYLDKKRKLSKSEKQILQSNDKLSDVFFNNIYKSLEILFNPFINKICVGHYFDNYEQTTFQLFGVDVAINDKYESKIMEINKGPDLTSKDERDKQLKINLLKNVFNLINDKPNEFIQLI